MTKGILGRKIGMTQVFSDKGELVPVTVVEAVTNVVLQKKTIESDGYEAIQLGYDNIRTKNDNETKKRAMSSKFANKPQMGHANKADTAPKRFTREIRGINIDEYEVGQEVKVDIFSAGELIDVTGISKGKGFQGPIKRHGQSRGPMAHGSRYHRRPGSMGSIQANRVPKGKKLAGRMGGVQKTVQNLEVIRVDSDRNLILIKGNIPGSKKALIKIQNAVKGQ